MQWGELSDLGDGYQQTYIIGGNYGVIGTPGRNNWRVVYAKDGVALEPSRGHPIYNNPTDFDYARERAERMEEFE